MYKFQTQEFKNLICEKYYIPAHEKALKENKYDPERYKIASEIAREAQIEGVKIEERKSRMKILTEFIEGKNYENEFILRQLVKEFLSRE